MSALVLGALPWAAPAATAGEAGPAIAVHELPEGGSALGVSRHPVQDLAKGRTQAAPALAVTARGLVAVALVVFDHGRERIELRTAASPAAALGPARFMAPGARAWGPRLAAAPDGAVWMAWCGVDKPPPPGRHDRSVFVRRVLPGRPGPVVRLSEGPGRACDPALAVDAGGRLHLAWEQSRPDNPDRVWIAYRSFDPHGRALGEIERVSEGRFERRPAVLAQADRIWVAWDALMDRQATGADDPDYDVFVRARGPKGFGPARAIDPGAGIQAAPALASAPGGGLLLAYQSSRRFSLVKWWALRRLRADAVEAPSAEDAAALIEPSGEQQGAEFPALAALPSGRVAIFSRPSQGTYLQLVDASGISAPLDLTRRGWGARGMRTAVAAAPDGSLLMVRRARMAAVLERFTFDGKQPGPPRFEPIETVRNPGPKTARRPPAGWAAADAPLAGPGMKAFFGDVHMHSAASDATGPPDEVLARAWVRGAHFAVLTDHDNIIGQRQPPSMQDEIDWLTDAFDAREGFACLHGYEWTTPSLPKGCGHRNVYFRDRPKDGWCGYRGACPDTAALFASIERGQALAVPHHTSWTGTDWGAFDETVQRLFEIASVHGVFEHEGAQLVPARGDMRGMTAVAGLDRGLRFGFNGGSDGHGLLWHHGIGRKRNPWHHGLTVAYARDLSRPAIFDAMYARRTGATTGVPIRAIIRVGDLPMGGAGELAAPVPIQFSAAADGGRIELDLIRDGRVIHRLRPGSPSLDGRFVDAKVDPGPHFYYIRVVQRGGEQVELAWSSPVFVTVEGPKGRPEGVKR